MRMLVHGVQVRGAAAALALNPLVDTDPLCRVAIVHFTRTPRHHATTPDAAQLQWESLVTLGASFYVSVPRLTELQHLQRAVRKKVPPVIDLLRNIGEKSSGDQHVHPHSLTQMQIETQTCIKVRRTIERHHMLARQ